MKKLRILYAAALLLCLPEITTAQQWLKTWLNPQANFYTVRDAFYSEERRDENRRANRKGREAEGPWEHFKRWEYFIAPRVYPSGDLTLPSNNYRNFQEYLVQNPDAAARIRAPRSSFSWNELGPIGAPTSFGGAGRINAVRFDPVNSDVIYACAPAGGLWKTTDGGGTWTNNNDFLSLIGCSDLCIDHTNPQVMYLATGDNDAGDTYSIGVLKSTDGGLTWNPTTLAWTPAQSRRIYRLLIDPTNAQILYAGTNNGIYKTLDGGTTWSQISGISVTDMEFNPADPHTLYACGQRFYRSNNSGGTWTAITAGTPSSQMVSRLAIAVTPADDQVVYLVAGSSSNQGFMGMYRSTDTGLSFSLTATTPNLLGWDVNGGDSDGQAWYTLSVAASPMDPDAVAVGGVNIWYSGDGGYNWGISAHWYGANGTPYAHADVHDLIFKPGSGTVLFSGCDGGVFQTTNLGASWNDISGNMGIAQIYRMGLSASTAGKLITGHQDNGTNFMNGTAWDRVLGGDGMDCFIDWSDDNTMYGELYYGAFNRSDDGGQTWSGITNGLTGNAGWVTPWTQDPFDPNTLYAGYTQIFKSTDRGDNWSQLGTAPSGSTFIDIVVAPSDNNVIVAATPYHVVRTSDGGQTWTSVTAGLPTSSATITRVAISSYDANKMWVTFSGYAAAAKVFVTNNGGVTWSNISAGLPNLPVNCVAYMPGTSCDAVFVGCDVGVYAFNGSTWIPYFSGLAHAPVFDIEVFKPTWKLRAATYGRGVWECDIDTTMFAPRADFTAGSTQLCPGQSVTFTDQSTFNLNAWSWIMPGATPAFSNAQNPTVTYSAPGIYPVTLIATNTQGSDTKTQTNYIYVGATQPAPLSEGFVSPVFLPAGWSATENNNLNEYWKRSATVGHNSSESAVFNNFNNSLNGGTADMRTAMLNFSAQNNLSLQFDVAYCRYNSSRSDTLQVLVSTDCGQTFTQVYLKGGTNLSTKSDQTTAFTPTNNQWRTETVSLAAYNGSPSLMIAFRNRGHHGQFLYIDNINITGTPAGLPVAQFFTGQPNVCLNAPVSFTDLSAGAPNAWNWSFPGANTTQSSVQNPSGITWSVPGTYNVQLIATNVNGSDTLTQTINVLPAPAADAGPDTAICNATVYQLGASGGIAWQWQPYNFLSNPGIATPLVQLTSARTYTVTVTDSSGCTAVDSVHLTLLPVHSFSVSGPINICSGDTTLLVCSDSTLNYVWNYLPTIFPLTGDSVYVSPMSNTPYIVTGTDSNGCAVTVQRSVSTYPAVNAPVITINGNVLTSSALTGNQWYLNNVAIPGATAQTYTVLQQGYYTVIVTNNVGCTSLASAAIIVSVQQLADNPAMLQISPNPGDGIFHLSFELPSAQQCRVRVFNLPGQEIFVQDFGLCGGPQNREISLEKQPAGTYLLQFETDELRITRRIVIK
jgi:PKD repeat protein/photosystem II stability/assembly factor-like uncharacterized protein